MADLLNKKSVTVFYNKYFSILRDFAYSLTKNYYLSENISSQILTEIIKRLEVEKEIVITHSIKSYLFKAVKYKLVDIDRKSKRPIHGGKSPKVPYEENTEIVDPSTNEETDFLPEIFKSITIKPLIERVSDPLVRQVAWLTMAGATFKEICGVFGLAPQKLKNIYYRQVIQELQKANNKKNFLGSFDRLSDFETIFYNWKQDYHFLNANIETNLLILDELLINNLPVSDNLDIRKFKSDVQTFLLELLVNKGQTYGSRGAVSYAEEVFKICDDINEIESLIRVKKAQSIALRINKDYEKALQALNEAEQLTILLKAPNKRKRTLNSLQANKGRLFSRMGFYDKSKELFESTMDSYLMAGNQERISVRKSELAFTQTELHLYDSAFDNLEEVRNLIPANFINGEVKYNSSFANLLFYTQDYENGYQALRRVWELSDRAGLINQFEYIVEMINKHSLDPLEFLTKEEFVRCKVFSTSLKYKTNL